MNIFYKIFFIYSLLFFSTYSQIQTIPSDIIRVEDGAQEPLTDLLQDFKLNVNSISNDLDRLESDVESVSNTVDTIQFTLFGTTPGDNSNLTTIPLSLLAQDTAILANQIDSNVSSISNDLDTLELNVSSISNDLDTLESNVSSISNDLDTAELNFNSISNDISYLSRSNNYTADNYFSGLTNRFDNGIHFAPYVYQIVPGVTDDIVSDLKLFTSFGKLYYRSFFANKEVILLDNTPTSPWGELKTSTDITRSIANDNANNISSIGGDLDTLELNVNSISNNLDNVDTVIQDNLTPLIADVSSISNNLDTLELNASTISNDLDTLELSVGTIGNDLNTLESSTGYISNNVAFLNKTNIFTKDNLFFARTNLFKYGIHFNPSYINGSLEPNILNINGNRNITLNGQEVVTVSGISTAGDPITSQTVIDNINEVYFLNNAIASVSNDLDVLEVNVSTISNDLDILELSVSSISNDLDNIDTVIQDNLTPLIADVSSISNDLDNIDTVIQDNLTPLIGDVSSISNDLDTLELNVSSISNDLDNIDTVIQDNLTPLIGDVSSISNDLDTLEQNVSSISNDLDNIDTVIQDNLTPLISDVSSISNDLDALEIKVGDVQLYVTNEMVKSVRTWTSIYINTNYNAAEYEFIFADTTSTNILITLPDTSTASGKVVGVRKQANENLLLIAAPDGSLVQGVQTVGLQRIYNVLTLVSDGNTNWFIK